MLRFRIMDLNQHISRLALEIIAKIDQNEITLGFLEQSLAKFAGTITDEQKRDS